jgi:folate-dependent phosphoribosylglycinamide formyltransferase PurN
MNDSTLDKLILSDKKGRIINSDLGDSKWGQEILPAPDENPEKSDKGLKVVVFASYLLGYLLFETLRNFEEKNPGRLNIVGLVTDDPVSPDAKISVKRRIYRLYDDEQIANIETAMVESGLKAGVPVYTGAVRTEYFRELLKKWDADAILVCVFGQIIDSQIINFPKYGIYNFHPADLAAGHGAGPQPFQDLIDRDALTSKVTIHQLNEQLDEGHILGQSSPINVRFADGSITKNILVLDDKMLYPIDVMAAELIKTLILKKELGVGGKIEKLDFSKHFTPAYQAQLLMPIRSNKPTSELPKTSKFVDYRLED